MGRYLMFGVHDFYLLIFGFYDGSLLILFLDIYTKWAMLPALSNRPTKGKDRNWCLDWTNMDSELEKVIKMFLLVCDSPF
jgi:hypothetical protein